MLCFNEGQQSRERERETKRKKKRGSERVGACVFMSLLPAGNRAFSRRVLVFVCVCVRDRETDGK